MIKQFSVLVVDDEPRILKFLKISLAASGYEVLTAGSGPEAIDRLQAQEPDMIVLDVIMPGMDGFETLKQVRAISSIPVIILSGKEANADKVKGLKLGADDYLTKPFSPDELMARIEAVRRRLAPEETRRTAEIISIGHITLNPKRHLVLVEGKEITLSRIEWLLLNELIRNAGRLMLYEELLTRLWGPEYRSDVQILRTWISRLRHKIETDTRKAPIIRTIPKTGYIIDTEEA